MINIIKPYLKHLFNVVKLNQLRLKYPKSRISRNCLIQNATITSYVKLGDGVRFINSSIKEYSYISPYGIIIGTNIGKFCSIGPGVKIGLGIHPLNYVSTSPNFYDAHLYKSFAKKKVIEHFEKVEIADDVWIGANVMIMGGVKIGHGAVIGAGALVTKDVEPFSVVVGTPAKHIKYRLPKEQQDQLLKSEWWNWSFSKIRENADEFLDVRDFNKIL